MNKIHFIFKTLTLLILFLLSSSSLKAQNALATDTTIVFTPTDPNLVHLQSYRPLTHAWGMDLLMSNNGFGLGAFYRYEMTDNFSLMINFAISDVKDNAESEVYDYYGYSFIPGKKNRLLLIPLLASVEYRLFRDDIVDNFRPYVSAGLGPTMVFVAPYSKGVNINYLGSLYPEFEKIDFFTSLKYGKLRYTVGGYVGAGAYFGLEKGSLTGLSIKYIFAPFPDGIEVMYGGYMKNFGGLFITLTFGALF